MWSYINIYMWGVWSDKFVSYGECGQACVYKYLYVGSVVRQACVYKYVYVGVWSDKLVYINMYM